MKRTPKPKTRAVDPMLPVERTGWGAPPADGRPTDDSLDVEFAESVSELAIHAMMDELTVHAFLARAGDVPALDPRAAAIAAERLDLARQVGAALRNPGATPLVRALRLAYRLGCVSMEEQLAAARAEASGPKMKKPAILRAIGAAHARLVAKNPGAKRPPTAREIASLYMGPDYGSFANLADYVSEWRRARKISLSEK